MIFAFFANFDNKPNFNPFHSISEEDVIKQISCDIGEQMPRELTEDEEAEIAGYCKQLYQLPNLIYTVSLSLFENFYIEPIETVEGFYVERLEKMIEVCKHNERDFIIASHIGLYHFTVYRVNPIHLEPYQNVLRQHTINQIIKDLQE